MLQQFRHYSTGGQVSNTHLISAIKNSAQILLTQLELAVRDLRILTLVFTFMT